MVSAKSSTAAIALGLLVMTLVGDCYGQLSYNYYNKKCGSVNVEEVTYYIVRKHFLAEADTVSDLVRLMFHDCAIRGCDASILLEGPYTEKTAPPNFSVGGYEIIEEIKVTLEKYCPGVVSCADLVVLAARTAVYLGGADWYNVETGRKDGRISSATEAKNGLPPPNIPVSMAINLFAKWGLSAWDFVVLLGCHTAGTAHCSSFQDRLYNYNGKAGTSDPYMNPYLMYELKQTCPQGPPISGNEAFLDQTVGSEYKMDNAFFKRILEGKGILQVDQMMAVDPKTKGMVQYLASDPRIFRASIGPSMRQFSRFGVSLTGEVRVGTCKKTL